MGGVTPLASRRSPRSDLDAGETWHFSGGLFDSGTPDHAKVKVDECYQ